MTFCRQLEEDFSFSSCYHVDEVINMKKFISILITLSLTFCCGCNVKTNTDNKEQSNPYVSGDLIATTMKVPEHYEFESTSESGKSKVVVNADIYVPEVSKVDVLEAIPVVFTDEDAKTFIERHTDSRGWYHVLTHQPYSGEGLTKEVLEGDLLGNEKYFIWVDNNYEENVTDKFKEVVVSFWKNAKTGEIAYQPCLSYMNSSTDPQFLQLIPLNENNMANGCSITLEEAKAFANDEVSQISPDFSIKNYGQLKGKSLFSEQNSQQYYGFEFTRNINGIPVNLDNERGVGDGSEYTSGTEKISVTVNDDGVCWLKYCEPFKTGKVVQEDVELLSFDEIADIFENVSMLSIQHLELEDGLTENLMDIREIRFGYMAVKQPGSIGGYRYIPVWDFYGIHWPVYENSQYYPDNYKIPEFTINAIDGTVIDRDMGY